MVPSPGTSGFFERGPGPMPREAGRIFDVVGGGAGDSHGVIEVEAGMSMTH